MVPVIKNTIEWIKRNKQVAILVGGILILFILVIIALLPKSKTNELALIEQPLYFYQKKSVTLGEDIYKSFKLKNSKYKIFKIKDDNLNIKVEGIMSQLLINAPTKTGYANVFYKWENKSGDKVEYNAKSQSIKINLSNRLDVFPDVVSPSDDQLKQLLTTFSRKYINPSFEYSDVTLEKKPNEIIISGRRLHDGLPLQYSGILKNSDYISLDERYNLKSANISLVTFEDVPADNLSLLKPKDIAKVISSDNYPREINTDNPGGLELQENNVDVKEFADNIIGYQIPKPSSLKVKSLELVYLFSNVDQKFLTPVYRMDVEGQIQYQNNTYNVQGVVKASAIDPNHVYIPSNISYVE